MLKYLTIPLLLAAMLLGWNQKTNAQSVELHALITTTDGQEQLFYLTEDDQLSFEGQETLTINSQGTTAQFNIDDIQKIEFVDVTATKENAALQPFLYPNPVRNTLVIGNINDDQSINIYALDGRWIQQIEVHANQPIDLSGLHAGMYILNMGEKNYKLLKL